MKIFFACKKSSSSSLNNLDINPGNSSTNQEEKNNPDNLLLSTNDNNNSSYNLEIIDYPYSSNFNDDKTVTMNSACKNINTKNKTNILINNYNPQKILKEERNNSIKLFNYDFYNSSSNSSSGIINNEDSVIQNKMLLNAYYQNYNNFNPNNINNKNNIPNKKQIKYNFQKNKIKGKKIKDNTLEIKVEYPNPDSQEFLSKSQNNYGFKFRLNKTDLVQNKLSKKLKMNFKKGHIVATNKTLKLQKKDYCKNRSKKTIETLNSDVFNLSKSNSRAYNTGDIYINKSYNSLKDYKIHFGKLRPIINRKEINQRLNTIKKGNNLNNKTISIIQKHKTVQKLKTMNKSIKSILFKKKIIKNKPMHSSNSDFKLDLLSQMKKKLGSPRDIKPFISKKNIIEPNNKQIKTRNKKKKVINKKKLINPFVINEENTIKK